MAKGILIGLLLLFTFPLFIGLVAGGFGIVIGICGAIIGVIAGVFGAIFGLIGAIFDLLFGGVFNWNWHGPHLYFPHHFHLNGFAIAAIVIVAALIVSKQRRQKN